MPCVTSAVVLLDYITKKLIEAYIQPHEVIDVLPFLRIVNVKNTGAAFGSFSNLSNNIFIIISIAAIILITIYMLSILAAEIGNYSIQKTLSKQNLQPR